MQEKDFELSELPNGIRIIHHEVTSTRIANVGIMLDIGSRDEAEDQQGLAHFLEHMAFKGTRKRSAYQIINRLESVGGELNAYTTKEKICFYASVLDEHLSKAVELLTDITFHSTFPQKQIDKERMVILEEINMYQDTPEDAIQDDFDEILFPNHPLGRNILGTKGSISTFQQGDFRAFLAEHMRTDRIVISSVGNFSMKKIERLVSKYLKGISSKTQATHRSKAATGTLIHKKVKKNIYQSHFVMGLPSIEIHHPDRTALFFLCNILGGPGMNSKLNLSLREKYGLVYGIDASYAPYTDTGQLTISLATDAKNLKKSQTLIRKEINDLKKKPLSQRQLQVAKNQIKGQMAMSEENKNAVMLMMAKSQLDLNKIPDLNTVFAKIDAVTAGKIQELSAEHLQADKMSTLAYLPE
ncbi:MAG: pitrilysin family protein [Bacteroidota bacterium]